MVVLLHQVDDACLAAMQQPAAVLQSHHVRLCVDADGADVLHGFSQVVEHVCREREGVGLPQGGDGGPQAVDARHDRRRPHARGGRRSYCASNRRSRKDQLCNGVVNGKCSSTPDPRSDNVVLQRHRPPSRQLEHCRHSSSTNHVRNRRKHTGAPPSAAPLAAGWRHLHTLGGKW